MLRIGDFSKLTSISIRMLRHYNEIGLLMPACIDSFTGYRYYNEAQLPAANHITALKDMGFSLAAIKDILKNYSDAEAMKAFLLIKQKEIEEQSCNLSQQLLLLKNTIKRIGKENSAMIYPVTLKIIPERYVASVRKVIPHYNQEGSLWKILMEETAMLHLIDGDPCYTLAMFHDKEYKETNVDVEIQKSVCGSYENTENVVFKTVPSIQIASATYKGSYDLVTEANEAVANWVQDNGYDFYGPSFFIYHVSPHETQDPQELVTEVCYPVKKR